MLLYAWLTEFSRHFSKEGESDEFFTERELSSITSRFCSFTGQSFHLFLLAIVAASAWTCLHTDLHLHVQYSAALPPFTQSLLQSTTYRAQVRVESALLRWQHLQSQRLVVDCSLALHLFNTKLLLSCCSRMGFYGLTSSADALLWLHWFVFDCCCPDLPTQLSKIPQPCYEKFWMTNRAPGKWDAKVPKGTEKNKVFFLFKSNVVSSQEAPLNAECPLHYCEHGNHSDQV